MSIINFIVFFTIAVYCLGYTIYGFYQRMSQGVASLKKYRGFFNKFCLFLDYIGFVPMYFGQFIAWLLIKLNDFINFVCNLFKKKK